MLLVTYYQESVSYTHLVVNQIEATESGVLKKQLAEEGDTVDVAAPVAILETK